MKRNSKKLKRMFENDQKSRHSVNTSIIGYRKIDYGKSDNRNEQEATERRERNTRVLRRMFENGQELRQSVNTSNAGYSKSNYRNGLEEKSSYHHEDILMYGAMLFDTSESESHDTGSFDDGGYDDTSFSSDFDFGGFDGESDGDGASDDF